MLIYRNIESWEQAKRESRMEVHWGQDLKRLADEMFRDWSKIPYDVEHPFRRACIVVDDVASQKWLEQYFLYESPVSRKVLADIDIRPISPLLNDWLFALVHGEGKRNASTHPYSRECLCWRIEAILREEGGEYPRLQRYLGDGPDASVRRYELSVKIAAMLDEYLNQRFAMLLRWEKGEVEPGEEEWQAKLYRRLLEDVPETYVKEYLASAEVAPSSALEHGFPDYSRIYVFDVVHFSPAYLELLLEISRIIPVSFWNFNPAGVPWLDEPRQKQVRREVLAEVEKGAHPESVDLFELMGEKGDVLLGSLGCGGRALLGMQADLMEGDIQVPDDELEFPENLKRVEFECHRAYTPRREMEAVRDGILEYVRLHPETRPRDIAVLCGDWNRYLPEIEAVFGTEQEEGQIPCMPGGAVTASRIQLSFREILAFGSNRFEISAVMRLLQVPAIREKAGLSAEQVEDIQKMLETANVHWGYDDADVKSILEDSERDVERNPFTWRRGLDRMLLEALLGDDMNGEIFPAGELGNIMPCGPIEGEKADALLVLAEFVRKLAETRRMLRNRKYLPIRAPEAEQENWRNILLGFVASFYLEDDAYADELRQLRRVIVDVTEKASMAVPGRLLAYDSRQMLAAIGDSLGNPGRGGEQGDLVRFDMLKSSAAKPCKLLWICGLNDGVFPRNEHRMAFDLIGLHPTLLDLVPREQDAFALLKAVCSAECKVVFSYQGRNPKLNEDMPPSVLLSELLEYLGRKVKPVLVITHPMQAYSSRYFRDDSQLPPSYSRRDYEASKKLYLKEDEREELPERELFPFKMEDGGTTYIDISNILFYLNNPVEFIRKKRLAASDVHVTATPDDREKLDIGPNYEMQDSIYLMGRTPNEQEVRWMAECLRERGGEPDVNSLMAKITNSYDENYLEAVQAAVFSFPKDEILNAPSASVLESYLACAGAAPVLFRTPVFPYPLSSAQGVSPSESFVVTGSLKWTDVEGADGVLRNRRVVLNTGRDKAYRDKIKIDALVHHLAGHAAGYSFITDIWLLYPSEKAKKPKLFSLPVLTMESARNLFLELMKLVLTPLPDGSVDDYAKAMEPVKAYLLEKCKKLGVEGKK